jgi:hypothetical protein
MNARPLFAALLTAVACAAGAQTTAAQSSGALAPSRPSTPSGPSAPREIGPDGVAIDPLQQGTPATTSRSPNAPQPRTRNPGMLGPGAFGTSTGLENVLNSGTPPAYDRKSGTRKVCPPELENRNNVCVAPVGSVISN